MTVHLVGGGCGRPLWVTIEARELISRADHLVYDSLVHPDLLQLAPPSCHFHFVGKRKGESYLSQDQINSLLAELGQTGNTVVRLKGGDPFIFGRGGEEALALQEKGIPWTYVPGITAAIGGPGSAGIPPTHRGLSESFTLMTGHRRKGAPSSCIISEHVASSPGTLAIYMGASSWNSLARELLDSGMDPETHCAAVTWGGWGRSGKQSGPLKEMADRKIPSPSIMITGKVAALPLEPLAGPLQGMQVALARPFPESWKTARMLEEIGADAYSIPILGQEELNCKDEQKVLSGADLIVLTSPRGSRLLTRMIDPRRIKASIAVIGEGTASALLEKGIKADHVAEPQTSIGLARLLSEVVSPGMEVVFFRNERGSDLPVDAVRKRDAMVKILPAYRMISTTPPGMDSYRKQWDENGLDAVVFGSGALVEAWKDMIGELPGNTIPVAWGQPCGETVRKVLKREPVIMAEPDLEGMVSALKKIRNHGRVIDEQQG